MSRRAPFIGGPADGRTLDLWGFGPYVLVPEPVSVSLVFPPDEEPSPRFERTCTYTRKRFVLWRTAGEPLMYEVLVPEGAPVSNERALARLLLAAEDYISELEERHGPATR